MLTSPPLTWKLALLAAAGFLFLPWTRGPLLLLAAALLVGAEVRTARSDHGKHIELLIDGRLRKLPAGGGSVPFGDSEIQVARIGQQVSNGQLLSVGEVLFRGSSLLEVIR